MTAGARRNKLASVLRWSRLLPFLLCAPLSAAELNVLQDTTVDASALNFAAADVNFGQNVNGRTHQRFPISTFRGYQYITYYDSNRNVALGRRKLPTGNWEIIRFADYTITNNDSHNTATLGICALDGTIHLAFDHHKDPLHYRVSSIGVASNPESVAWSTSLFSSVTDTLGPLGAIKDLTYPTFVPAPNGNLLFYYRNGGSGSGDGIIYEYDGSTHNWTAGLGQFISRSGTYNGALSSNSTTRNPYLNGISYGGDRLHASWGWRESSAGAKYNHDLNYAYSDDHGRTWRNNAGAVIGNAGSSSISINSSGLLVAPIPQNIGLSNAYTQYEYDDGSIHVMVSHHESGTTSTRYHHYWRNSAGAWSFEALPFSGSRPKMAGDDDRTLFLVYKSGGRIRVAKGVPNASQTAWTWSVAHIQSDATEGGDGQLDYERWESDRILSVYGQESPNAAGDPTPLHVYDYQVSAKAVLPVPAHELTDVAESTSLQWTAGIGAVSHRVYLGADFAVVRDATTASPEYVGQQSTTQFTPAHPLHEGTRYYWRIDEVDGSGAVTLGLIWSFSTPGNFAPTITGIANQTTARDTALPALAFTIGDDSTAVAGLQVTARSSNPVLLPESGITLGGSGADRTVQVTPAVGQTGVGIVSIRVSDGARATEEHFSVSVTGPLELILSTTADAGIKETPAPVDASKTTTYVGTGGNSPRIDRSVVFVFQLPDLGATSEPFAAVSFTFNYSAKTGTLQANDLYGLGRRSSPTVVAGDYHGQTTALDPTDATLLQRNILNDGTAFGLISPSSAGQGALRDYLNAQYASGAGIGEYVFLRLNTAGKRDAIDRATLTMSEGGQTSPTDTRPRISFTRTLANQAPTISRIDDQTITRDASLPALVFVIDDDITDPDSLQVSAQSSNTLLLPQSGVALGGSGKNRTIQLSPAAGKTGIASVTISVADGAAVTQETFTLTVSGPTEFLLSAAQDAGIKENLAVVDAAKTTTLLGTVGSSPRVDRCTIYVFQLPDLGPIAAPFVTASLTFEYAGKQGTLHANDLYGLGRRASPAVLGSDYHGKTSAVDASDATLLETDILTDATPLGLINTSPSGSSALRDYLNAQYASGAGAGQFVFIRLNTAANRDSIDRATLTMSEGGQTQPLDTRPRISFTRIESNPLRDWRMLHFGTACNSGNAADDADPNSDGESNLLEFVTGQDPKSATRMSAQFSIDGRNLKFTFPRNVEAASEKLTFMADWSDALPGAWSNAGVTEAVESDNGSVQTVTATVPKGAGSQRFVRLRIIRN